MVEQSNPGGRRLRSIDLLAVFCFCCVCADAENTPKPSSARETPASSMNRPIKTRRLKKAERVEERFFMLKVWGNDGAHLEGSRHCCPRSTSPGYLRLGRPHVRSRMRFKD